MNRFPFRLLAVATILLIAAIGIYLYTAAKHQDALVFPGITGPQQKTTVPPAVAARWQQYGDGGASALAILLTDPDSAWLGLAHGLKTIGVPFRITTDVHDALQHKVVLVYPIISGRALSREALQALAAFPRNGGTLVGFNIAGGGLGPVFGFDEMVADRARFELRFDTTLPVTKEFTDPREQVIPINKPGKTANDLGVFGNTEPRSSPHATYDNGVAAILHRAIGSGHAYAIGVDIGFFLLKGYNSRQQGIARSYANDFEPALDVLLRLLRNIYRQGEPDAVTLGTVPQARQLSVILTHDIDYTKSIRNALVYAQHEHDAGISATHFIQTKYIRDWNDDVFFNQEAVVTINKMAGLGMEIGSHSVSHSRVFNKFELGSGKEQYPQYRPFVRDATHTENGTILGELRVSRFLLGKLIQGDAPVSFRPGYLENPYILPQSLEATGYRYSSSVTANNALTHLPYRLTYGRETTAQSAIYEFPIAIEDEHKPRLGDRLPQALAVADKLSRYGGLFVVLIHPDVLDHKLEFQKGLVRAFQDRAWFGSLRDFGNWWTARDQITWHVTQTGTRRSLLLEAPQPISDLALQLPANYRLVKTEPASVTVEATDRMLVVKQAAGRLLLEFETAGAKP